jgi:hypothetical protein
LGLFSILSEAVTIDIAAPIIEFMLRDVILLVIVEVTDITIKDSVITKIEVEAPANPKPRKWLFSF